MWSNCRLTSNRFDLGFKLCLLDALALSYVENSYDLQKSLDAYKDHIEAFSGGSFKEPDNAKKNSIHDYIEEFKLIYSSVEKSGFDEQKSIIPFASDGSIVNGSHRYASCIHLNKQCFAEKTNNVPSVFDYKFFQCAGVSLESLDLAALAYAKYATNIYLAIRWSASNSTIEKFDDHLGDVVYKKKININESIAKMAIYLAYQNESWIGSASNCFAGIVDKQVFCFPNFSELEVYLFHSATSENVLSIKDEIRKSCGIGKHSVHITDSKDEVLSLSSFFFDSEYLSFISYSAWDDVVKMMSISNKVKSLFPGFVAKISPVTIDCFSKLNSYEVESLQSDSLSTFLSLKKGIKFAPNKIDMFDNFKFDGFHPLITKQSCLGAVEYNESSVFEDSLKAVSLIFIRFRIRFKIALVRMLIKVKLYSSALKLKKLCKSFRLWK